MHGASGGRLVFLALTLLSWGLVVPAGGGVAVAAAPPEYELRSSFGPNGTESSGFGAAGPVSVDQQSGTVYVLDRDEGALFRFDADGNTSNFTGAAPYISGNGISGLTFFGGPGESQVAVDSVSHNIYVTSSNAIRAFQANGEPANFSAGPGIGTNEIGGFIRLTGLAVDGSGNIYASDRDAGTVTVFSPAGGQITQFSTENPANLAVDTNGVVYVNRAFIGSILKFTPSSFPPTAITTYTAASDPLSPTGSFTVAVDPATNYVYAAQVEFAESKIAVYDESGALLTYFAGPGEEGEIRIAEGIAINGSSGRVFIANKPQDESLSQVEIFDPKEIFEGPPTLEAAWATDVTADSVTLRGQINPNTAETTYYFEYGLEDCSMSTCARVPLNGAGIGAGHEEVSVAQTLVGLQAETLYHYRLVAENKFGAVVGSDRTFTTQSFGLNFTLIDSRVWEMVSPPNKHGGQLTAGLQAAEDGDGVAFLSVGSIEADPDGNRALERSAVLARRDAGNWQSEDITAANSRVIEWGARSDTEYNLFSFDLSSAVLEPSDGTQLSPQASERTPYLRKNSDPPVYTPLVTGREGFANVPSGTKFGGSPLDPFGAVRVAGANPEISHLALVSVVPLSAEAPEAPAETLYHWASGQLQPLSVLPEAEGGEIVSANTVGSGKGSTRHAISTDGSRIFWQRGSYGAAGNNLTSLYMRDTVAGETVRLDLVQPGASGAGAVAPVFQGANSDGTVAFFTDSQQLTEGASPDGQDLYRCEIPLESPPLGCSSLINLTDAAVNPGESADVQGLVPAISADGTSLYFVANGILDSAPNEQGANAVSGEPNLYHWEEGGDIRFIATLSTGDSQDWGLKGSVVAESSTLSSVGSPNGPYFSFMSQLSLTGQDNRDAGSGELVEQVFRYDAAEEQLDCISCDPTGSAPEGQIAPNRGRLLVDPISQWENRRIAAVLPNPLITEQGGTVFYRSRSALNNGRIFFNAFGGLVPADSNGEWDVYQFEPIGTGNCNSSSGSAATVAISGGCISLLSSGAATEESGFVDASVTGDDVFFITSAQLSATDKDDELDVYDARVDGIPAVLSPATPCTGEACQPTRSPPVDATPNSETFRGPGNVKGRDKKCPRGKRKIRRGGKTRCVRKHPKQKVSRKRSGHSRRAGR